MPQDSNVHVLRHHGFDELADWAENPVLAPEYAGRGLAPRAPLTVGDVRTTASQFLFYGEYSYAQTGGF